MIKFTLRIPDEFHGQLAGQATVDRRSLNSELLYLLEVGLNTVTAGTPNRPDGDSATSVPLCGRGHPRT